MIPVVPCIFLSSCGSGVVRSLAMSCYIGRFGIVPDISSSRVRGSLGNLRGSLGIHRGVCPPSCGEKELLVGTLMVYEE